jgi:hypothetical protein
MTDEDLSRLDDAKTIRKTTFSIMTLSITIEICDTQHNNKNITLSINKNVSLSIMTFGVTTSSVRLSFLYAECRVFDIVTLNAIMLNVVAPIIQRSLALPLP